MLDEAYQSLYDLEQGHWWYVGARAVYRTLLEIGLGKPDGSRKMLEVGSGSGGNLNLFGEYGPTVGAEFSQLALQLTRHPPMLGLVQASAEALPFASQVFDGVGLLGVIEHLDQDTLSLQEAARVCKQQGTVILLTSALPILWSHHDQANLHRRRYFLGQLRQRLSAAGLQPLRLSYQNFFVFFPTFLVRLIQRWRPSEPRYDMGRPPDWMNGLLTSLVKLEARWLRYSGLPVGVDLVAACRPQKEAYD